jgi:hypothetical protein
MPQKISVPSQDVKVYFRVSNVFKNVTFKVKDGEEVVLTRKKLTVAPGEMETIVLKGDLLNANKSGQFTIEMEAQND